MEKTYDLRTEERKRRDEEIRVANLKKRLQREKADLLILRHNSGETLSREEVSLLIEHIERLNDDLHEAWSDPDFH